MADDRLNQAELILLYQFKSIDLLDAALTHSSASNQSPSPNERLETLGDAVVTLLITEALFKLNPSADQGAITLAKSSLVSTRTLAEICREFGLVRLAKLGKGMERIPNRIAANLFEAVIGAVFLDGGIDATRQILLRFFSSHIEDPAYSKPDPKSQLQQLSHELHGNLPQYELLETSGPAHARSFRIRAVVGGRAFPEADGPNKKAAERHAARLALNELLAEKHGQDGKEPVTD